MSRTKIAPTLRKLCAAGWNNVFIDPPLTNAEIDAEWDRATVELKSLIAVASAAERVNRYAWPDGTPPSANQAPLARAIARLRSLSSPPSRRTARGTKGAR